MTLQKPVLPALRTDVPLQRALAALEEDETLCGFAFKDEMFAGEWLNKLECKGCTFHACRFTEASFENAFFQNCIFENCDFTAARFTEATLQKVQIKNCKLAGTGFADASLADTAFTLCVGDGVVLAGAMCRHVAFTQCRMQMAAISDLRPRSTFAFTECDLRQADFSHTMLKGQDLTTNDIDGAAFTGEELRGAVVTAQQACELARLLGVIIK